MPESGTKTKPPGGRGPLVFSVVSFGPESSRIGEGGEDGRELWVKADISVSDVSNPTFHSHDTCSHLH